MVAVYYPRRRHPENGLGLHYKRLCPFLSISPLSLSYLLGQSSKNPPPIGQDRLGYAVGRRHRVASAVSGGSRDRAAAGHDVAHDRSAGADCGARRQAVGRVVKRPRRSEAALGIVGRGSRATGHCLQEDSVNC